VISGFVRLCFGALLNSLDGLRRAAFAQRGELGDGFSNSFDGTTERTVGIVRRGYGHRIIELDAIAINIDYCIQDGNVGAWPLLQRYGHLESLVTCGAPNGYDSREIGHTFHSASARARRQGPGVLSTAQGSANI
jgi:hypothetical protein